jgi:Acetyltransferase (GNAT) family
LTVRIALDGDAIIGGICYERYPRSGCGLVTYLVVAPAARGRGLGEHLLREAVEALAAPIVLGEVNDPRLHGDGWERLERFQRWGARVLEARYVQPALGPGLARDRGLLLIAFAGATPLPMQTSGALVLALVEELYAATEGGAPDPEVLLPELIQLVELRR